MEKEKEEIEIIENEKNSEEIQETLDEYVEIIPEKDFEIRFNDFHYVLKCGEKIKVHKMFICNLMTENVI